MAEKIIPTPRVIMSGSSTGNPWGAGTKYVLAVDPGAKGGVVAGESIDDCRAIPYPQDSMEFRDFCRDLYLKHKIDPLQCSIYCERRPVSDKVPGGAARIYQMGVDDGCWGIVAVAFAQKFSLYPQEWRRQAFPTLKEKPVGSMAWKALEAQYTRFFTGNRLIGDKNYKSDHPTHGVAAAFCIWLAGCQAQMKMNIEQEIARIKGDKNG